MKQFLSIKRLLLLVLVSGIFYNTNAQTIITTTYTNAPVVNLLLATPSYITFTVNNANTYPITLTDLQIYHDSTTSFNAGAIHHSQNGSVYTLIRLSSTTGVPNLTTYTTVGTSAAPIYASGNGIVPVISGMNEIINGGATVRYAVINNDSIIGVGANVVPFVTALPTSFTTNGVTLITFDGNPGNQYWGQFPIGAQFNGQSFDGAIGFRRAGPTVTVINNNPCDSSGDTVTLVATVPAGVTGATINWQGPNGMTFTGSPWKIPAFLANKGQYSATYSVPGPPAETSAPTTVNVNINSRPAAPVLTAKTAYCIGEPFQPISVTGSNISWYTTPTGGTGTTIPPYVNTNAAGSYTWYASQSPIVGCEGPRTGITITVAPKPKAPTVTSPVSYCEGETPVALSAGAVGDLTWYVDPTGGLGSSIAPIPGTSVQDTLTWYVSQTVDGCEGPRSKIDVVVTFKPNGMIVVSDTPWICAQTALSFQYFGSGVPSTGYNWTLPKGAVITGGTTGPGPLTIRFDSAGTQQLVLQANNLGCYSDKFIQNIKVKPLPTGRIYIPSDVCLGAQSLIQIIDYTPTIDSFNWMWDGGITTHFATDQGPYGVYWKTPGKHGITVDLADNLCHTTITDSLMVRELPDARITGYLFNDKEQRFDSYNFNSSESAICASDSIRFEPNTIVASSKYQWTPSRFFDNYDKIPVTYGRVDFTGFINLKVTDDLGCVNTDSVRVRTKPCCELTFPNAFTPNGDGHNDRFSAITPGFHNAKTFRIVNRWGQTVYETTDEHNGWDGNMRGEPADMGTYYFYINFKCDGKFVEQRGEFILVR